MSEEKWTDNLQTRHAEVLFGKCGGCRNCEDCHAEHLRLKEFDKGCDYCWDEKNLEKDAKPNDNVYNKL